MRAVLSRLCSVAAYPANLASSGPTIWDMGAQRSVAAVALRTVIRDEITSQARVIHISMHGRGWQHASDDSHCTSQCATSSWSELPAPAHLRAQQPASAPSDSESPASTPYRLSPEPFAAADAPPGSLHAPQTVKSARRRAAEAFLAARHAPGSAAARPLLTSAASPAVPAAARSPAAATGLQQAAPTPSAAVAIPPRPRAAKRKRGDAAADPDEHIAAAPRRAEDSVLVRACRDSAACCTFMRRADEASAEDAASVAGGELP